LLTIGLTETNQVVALEVVQLVNLMPLVGQKLMNIGLLSQADFLKATENLMRCYFKIPQNHHLVELAGVDRRTGTTSA